ncbi:hypothetical protein ABZP36_017849 [Zizania latifolia]
MDQHQQDEEKQGATLFHSFASSSLPYPGDERETAPLLSYKMADEKADRIEVSEDTAHKISIDPWYQVGFVLTTGVNSAYVLGYSASIMVPLGWIGGTCGLILAAAISMYANALLARLHEVGSKRHIRYRDLAGHIYGITTPAKDYAIPGSPSDRIFTTIGSVASLVFAYNTGMLPEIQATIRPPVVKNMEKALWFQFTIGSLPLYAVTFMGYWAYGSSTSSYLLNSVKGPIWIKTVANLAAFLQTVIALHIFASPMYEFLDTKYGSGHGGPFAIHNVMFRVAVRGGYLTVNTLVAAMLPFLGDFMSLTGALSTFPLTFVLANHMYLMVNQHKLPTFQKCWHWLNVVGFSLLSVTAAVAALRLIIVDSSTYHLFADL